MIRLISAASIAAVALAAAPAAFAEPITTVDHFTTGHHTRVTDRVTVHTKTGVIDTHVRAAKADGETKTVSEKETPAATGGYSFSKSVTGFAGKTTTTTGTVSASHASAGRGGHGKA